MIVKIQPPSAKLTSTIIYNDRKVTGEEGIHDEEQVSEDVANKELGHVVTERNVPKTSTLENEFKRLEFKNKMTAGSRPIKNTAFHMSVNPGEDDRPLSEKEMVAFIDELMGELGYGDSPYRVYKHTDIEREHYHVVTTRIGQDGKKIKDSFEELRANRIARELEEKYGYTVGLKKLSDKEEKTVQSEIQNPDDYKPLKEQEDKSLKKREKTPQKKEEAAKKGKYIPPFDSKSSVPFSEQYRLFHDEAMSWSFSTEEQYFALMKYRFNTEVAEMGNGMLYTGLDGKGKPTVTPVSEAELGISALKDVADKIGSTKMSRKKSQKQRLEKLARWAADESKSWEDFRKLMSKKGVITCVSWSRNNEAFGITWLDRATKCAWKGSETSVDLKWLKQVAEDKGWTITRHHKYERMPAIRKTRLTASKIAVRKGHGKHIREQSLAEKLERDLKGMKNDESHGTTSDSSDMTDDIYEDETEKIMNRIK